MKAEDRQGRQEEEISSHKRHKTTQDFSNNASLGLASPEQDPLHGAGSNGEGVFQPAIWKVMADRKVRPPF